MIAHDADKHISACTITTVHIHAETIHSLASEKGFTIQLMKTNFGHPNIRDAYTFFNEGIELVLLHAIHVQVLPINIVPLTTRYHNNRGNNSTRRQSHLLLSTNSTCVAPNAHKHTYRCTYTQRYIWSSIHTDCCHKIRPKVHW